MRSLAVTVTVTVTVLALAACGPDTSTLSQPDMRVADLSMVQPMECANGLTDGEETDQDCGGPTCMPCDTGKSCKMGHDCASTFCTNNVCDAASCMDGVKNGTESDLDCGGSCSGCAVGKKCNAGSDCMSMTCTNGTCAASPCSNGKQDGAETDVDCGGGTCEACVDGKMCQQGTDCKSGTCTNNVCKSPVMCMAGTADCDGNAGNGCEINTNTDAKNCGACAKVCPMGMPTCIGGTCKGQVEVQIGNPKPLPGSGNWSGGTLSGYSITINKQSTLIRYGVVANPAGTKVTFGIYSDQNGPAALINSSPQTTLVGGPQEVQVPGAPLPPGTYWLMSIFTGDTQVGYDANGPLSKVYAVGADPNKPLPAMFPQANTGMQGPANFWIVVLQ